MRFSLDGNRRLAALLVILATCLSIAILWRAIEGQDKQIPPPEPLAAPPRTGQAQAPTRLPEDQPPTEAMVAVPQTGSGPTISAITTNQAVYPDGQIPKFEKLELTFQVATSARNPQLPYAANPPAGLEPGVGISVDGLFSPDDWKTVYRQPAFYFQEFTDDVKSGAEWFYPTGRFSWKVRFAADRAGDWQYKLVAQDASGRVETSVQSFTVTESSNPGFIRVSPHDRRYFEFQNGAYFLGLGYNMNFDQVSWNNPVLDNQSNFQTMQENGIQLVRLWLSEWGIFGSAWSPWNSIVPEQHGHYLPETGLTFQQAYPGSDVSMKIDAAFNPCMFIGAWKAPPAVKRNTNYRVRIRYKTDGIAGPRQPGKPFGFVAKTGDWLWGEGKKCSDPGTGKVVSQRQASSTADWQILAGTIHTGESDFLPYFYLTLENVTQGRAYVDTVWIEEDLGNGQYGPNILSKPWMAQHLYMDQRNSYAFDKVVELAKQYDIYLRPVILEKNDWIFNRIDDLGNPVLDNPSCQPTLLLDDSPQCPSNRWFYGNGRELTKVRWLQQAWWRYLQARWGYSTQIHSWELLNEGDPNSPALYTLADEFGKYMHQFQPDAHLVSTSFWNGFPAKEFLANPDYPNVDFADFHEYIDNTKPVFADTAEATNQASLQYGALEKGGPNKPVIRGEVGFIDQKSRDPAAQIALDQSGQWLHDFIWGQINPGGLIESYWFTNQQIYNLSPDDPNHFDFRNQFRPYFNFFQDIPLNNGDYRPPVLSLSNQNLRAWGQTDSVHGRAHLWIQNKYHTWINQVNQRSIPPQTGIIQLKGFKPGIQYTLQWWDPYRTDPAQQITGAQDLTADTTGTLTFNIDRLTSDIAVKIYPK